MTRRQMRKTELLPILCYLLLLCFVPSTATSLITANVFEARGQQRVCRVGKGRPCYKLAYFSEPRRRLNFGDAELACRRDGGELLSVESASEQKIIEQLITELRPSDGDFWIGLRRNHGDHDSSADCSSQYYWVDSSTSTFRNWHWDEPSCGYEVCVVMYHQPSAPPGDGGMYMFEWNDDNCETKNNFICKYSADNTLGPSPSPNYTQTDALPTSMLPWNPTDHKQDGSTALNLIYIIIPTIPLLLLLLTVTGVFCCKLLLRRRKKSEVCQTDPSLCPSPSTTDVYNVIRSQKDDDLAATRPHTKNTSFLCSSPDTPTGDYDNLGGRDTESGFVTLASTESGYLNFDLNDLSLGRRGARDFYDTSLGRSGKRDLCDTSLGRSGKRDLCETSLGRSGKRDLCDTSLGRSRKRDLSDTSLGHSGKRDLCDTSLGRSRKRDLSDTSLGHSEKRDLSDTSLGLSGKRDLCDTTLGHSEKRDLSDTSLGHSGKRDLSESSLGRRITKSEHRGSSVYIDLEMYEGSLVGRSDIYDARLGSGGHTLKADLYQTYMTDGKDDNYQTSLGYYGNRKSYQANMDCYRNDRSLTGGRRYFSEAEWVKSAGY
ncbi:layilin [Lampris incognitus]|uniref:layilin n=1 Tax=Lampris incognitus TaxID=2546036 RepID=UPI0024B51659|nr:layilin [Lampris incognitus]